MKKGASVAGVTCYAETVHKCNYVLVCSRVNGTCLLEDSGCRVSDGVQEHTRRKTTYRERLILSGK